MTIEMKMKIPPTQKKENNPTLLNRKHKKCNKTIVIL